MDYFFDKYGIYISTVEGNRIDSLPENAYFFDPFNANELAVLMEQLIHKEIKDVPVKKQEDIKINSWELVVNRIKECVS